jgi:hypothetical protein
MVTATETEVAAAGVTDTLEVVLDGAGYWHSERIEQLTGRGTVITATHNPLKLYTHTLAAVGA